MDALDRFELISDKGEIPFLPSCPNAHVAISPELEDNNDSHGYRIGLRPTNPGDHVDFVPIWANKDVFCIHIIKS